MEINGTLIVQIINFGIAYAIMRFFLLKPAVQEIDSEQQERNDVAQAITQSNQELEQLNVQRDDLWRSCKEYFGQNKPSLEGLDRFVWQNITPPHDYPKISDQKKEELVQDTSSLIIQNLVSPRRSR